MSRIRQPQRVARVVARNQPLESSQHIGTRRKERSATVSRIISQNDHILLIRGEASFANEEFADVHGVIDAAIQLVGGAGVVDSNEEGLLAGHCGMISVPSGYVHKEKRVCTEVRFEKVG